MEGKEVLEFQILEMAEFKNWRPELTGLSSL